MVQATAVRVVESEVLKVWSEMVWAECLGEMGWKPETTAGQFFSGKLGTDLAHFGFLPASVQ